MVGVIVTYLPVRMQDIDDIRKCQEIISAHHFEVLSSNSNSETADQPKQRNEGLRTKANMISVLYLRGSISP